MEIFFEEKIYKIENLEKLKFYLHNFFKNKNGILAAYLYGSILKEYSGHDLDIGIFTYCELDELRIGTEVENYLFPKGIKISIDLKILDEAPVWVKYNVIKEGIRIYSKDIKEIFEFEASIISEYLDFKYFIDEYDRMFLRRQKVGIK